MAKPNKSAAVVVARKSKSLTLAQVRQKEQNAIAAQRRLALRQAQDAERQRQREVNIALIEKREQPDGRAELERQFVEKAVASTFCGKLILQWHGSRPVTYASVKEFFRVKPLFSAHEPEDLLIPLWKRRAA